jgi:hypothetical protein
MPKAQKTKATKPRKVKSDEPLHVAMSFDELLKVAVSVKSPKKK